MCDVICYMLFLADNVKCDTNILSKNRKKTSGFCELEETPGTAF